MQDFSVLISVYHNDDARYFRQAVESVTVKQKLIPSEVVLVVDGPVPDELAAIVRDYEKAPNSIFKVIWLPENKGLGNALHIGVEAASLEIIARMDSDDIAAPDRFEKQLYFLNQHPDIDIFGGQIVEFINEPSNIIAKRAVPLNHNDIIKYIKSRCPFNHMTVMFRKQAIMSVGNYLPWHFNEDYYLWIRMAEAGCRFANMPDTLVNVRVGADMYRRRGGWKYFKSEKGLQDYMLRQHIISLPRYCYNVLGRFAVQVAMPNRLRGFIFKKLFRK